MELDQVMELIAISAIPGYLPFVVKTESGWKHLGDVKDAAELNDVKDTLDNLLFYAGIKASFLSKGNYKEKCRIYVAHGS